MPPLPSVPNMIKVTLKGTLTPDTDILNRLHFGYTGTNTPAIMNACAAHIGGAWASDVASAISSAYTLVEVKCTDLSSGTAPEGLSTTGWPGTDAAGVSLLQAALVMNATISRRYRGGKPKIFLAGIAADHLAGPDTWNGAFVSSFDAGWSTFIADCLSFVDGDFGLLLNYNVSYYEGFTAIENPITHRYRNVPTVRAVPLTDLIVGWAGDIKIGSQRRRRA